MQQITKWIDWVGRKRLLFYLAIVFFFLLFAEYLVIPALIGLSAGLALLTRVARPLRKIGIELVTFTTVLAGAQLGPAFGAVIALVTILAHLILGNYLGVYVLWVVPSYIVAGIAAGYFSTAVPQLGVTIAVVINAFGLVCTALFNLGGLAYFISYAVGNVLLNILLFTSVAPPLLTFMA